MRVNSYINTMTVDAYSCGNFPVDATTSTSRPSGISEDISTLGHLSNHDLPSVYRTFSYPCEYIATKITNIQSYVDLSVDMTARYVSTAWPFSKVRVN